MLARAFASTLLLFWAAACTKEIGDGCTTSSECATEDANRICITQLLEGFPGGYCTIFNCEPNSCPSESVCIGFRTSLANAEQCEGGSESTRLQRSYCMRTCSSDGDCRSGYACVDVDEDNPWGATVLERDDRRERSKICTVAYSEPDQSEDRSADVCQWRPRGELPDAAAPVSSSLPDHDAAAGAEAGALTADGSAPSTASDAASFDAAVDDGGQSPAPTADGASGTPPASQGDASPSADGG